MSEELTDAEILKKIRELERPLYVIAPEVSALVEIESLRAEVKRLRREVADRTTTYYERGEQVARYREVLERGTYCVGCGGKRAFNGDIVHRIECVAAMLSEPTKEGT